MVAVWATMWAVAANELDSLLHQLDHTIEVRDSLCNERRLGIHTAMMRVDAAGNDGDLYNIYRDLYGLYLSYRVDSAMWVAERRLQCAIRMHDQSKIISASLNLAESYSDTRHPRPHSNATLPPEVPLQHLQFYLYANGSCRCHPFAAVAV